MVRTPYCQNPQVIEPLYTAVLLRTLILFEFPELVSTLSHLCFTPIPVSRSRAIAPLPVGELVSLRWHQYGPVSHRLTGLLAHPSLQVSQYRQMARPATNRANDVFADRNGNVARRNGDNWDTRQNNSWKPAQRPERQPQSSTPDSVKRNAQQPKQRSSSFDRRDLNNAHNARNRGMSREMARPRGGRQTRRRR